MKVLKLSILAVLYFLYLPSGNCQKEISSKLIIVQPIVLQSDEGNDPASMKIPEELVDRAYEKAQVDFYFLEPIYFNNTKARDGEINLDSICKLAMNEKILKGYGDIVNMFFVNAVDGNKGPLGRGMFGGAITFIALGENSDPNLEAFVIGHEVGHNLSLKHIVDEPSIPDSIPNLLGDGEFSERIDPKYSLNNFQIELLHKSPLVHNRINFLSTEEAKKAIIDETYDPFFSKLQLREISAFTGVNVMDSTLLDARDFAQRHFSNAILEFSDVEKEAMNAVMKEITHILLENNLSLMANHPWRFVKVEKELCGGFAYTRGTFIVLSEKHLNKLTTAYNEATWDSDKVAIMKSIGGLIVHEQMHSLQSTYPAKFETLYQTHWNYTKGVVEPTNKIVKNQITNPDAPINNWLIKDEIVENKFYWSRVLLKEGNGIPVMGKDFEENVYEVTFANNTYSVITKDNGQAKYMPMDSFVNFKNRFPVTVGIDHPNEISAYMFSDFFIAKMLNEIPFAKASIESNKSCLQFINWCETEMTSNKLDIKALK